MPPPLRMTTPGSPSYVASENARAAWAEKRHGRMGKLPNTLKDLTSPLLEGNTQSISYRNPGSDRGLEMSTFAEEAAKARAAAEKLAAAEKDPIEDDNEGSDDGNGVGDVPGAL